MSVPRFHCPALLTEGATVELPPDAFHHAVRVRRLRIGDSLVLFAGDGFEASAKLVAIGRDTGQAEIESVAAVDRESTLDVTLLQGVSSGDRMDYTLQKAVELGVSAIVPVAMQRSMSMDGARAEKRAAHWRQIVISACEQSGRNVIPPVQPVSSLMPALAGSSASCRLLLSATGSDRLRDLSKPSSSSITLLAGPEGGLNDAEERAAFDAGFIGVSLGRRILRTETAAIAALAAMQALWGDS